jgi:acylpyruvate hydrolase
MLLVTFQSARGPRPGVFAGDDIVDLCTADPALPTDLRGILAANALERVARLRDSAPRAARLPRAGAKLLAPIANPGIVLSVGLNYRQHLEEMKTPIPATPYAFAKSVASIVGAGEPIVLPKSNPRMVDWEGELTVVIGKPCHAVRADDALDYVAGYTLVNDVSARDWVAAVFASRGVMGPIQTWEQNLLGKMFPTFCPMGPAIATRDELPDIGNVRLTTRSNGEIMQDANTNDLVFDIPTLIAHYSRFYRLLPGDCITTGSPSGVGYGREPKLFMKAGDVVEVAVEGIGVLRNPVVAG